MQTTLLMNHFHNFAWAGRGGQIGRARGLRAADREFGSGSSETYVLKSDTCYFLVWCSALLGEGNEWLAQCQYNVTEWDIRSCCWRPSFLVWQHYEVIMTAHCHK